MGQRLNIEIFNEGKVLANAYYHWSGYTSSALALTKTIIENIDKIVCKDDRLKAVWLLQTTGAGLPNDERNSIEAKDFTELSDFTNRNNGIIAVSHKAIQETRYWEEARVIIYLDEERINCSGIFSKDYKWDWEKENDMRYTDLPIVEWALDDIRFTELATFISCIEDMIKNKQYIFRTSDYPLHVYTMIE